MERKRKTPANMEIRKILFERGVAYWQVAKVLGVSENTIGRWMRTELDADMKKVFINAINRVER